MMEPGDGSVDDGAENIRGRHGMQRFISFESVDLSGTQQRVEQTAGGRVSQRTVSSDAGFFDGNELVMKDVTIGDGVRQLLGSVSKWFQKPRQSSSSPKKNTVKRKTSFTLTAEDDKWENEYRVDVTFDTTQHGLKNQITRLYFAVAIACWLAFTVVQASSLLTLNYWTFSPVIISVSVMAFGVIFYWLYIWHQLRLTLSELWYTPYPYAMVSAVLGSLAERAMYEVYNEYNIGQILIVFFLIQAFYVILVASTFQQYIGRWQKFINHRKLCFNALDVARDKALQRAIKRDAANNEYDASKKS